jgi:hypothetical protein
MAVELTIAKDSLNSTSDVARLSCSTQPRFAPIIIDRLRPTEQERQQLAKSCRQQSMLVVSRRLLIFYV